MPVVAKLHVHAQRQRVDQLNSASAPVERQLHRDSCTEAVAHQARASRNSRLFPQDRHLEAFEEEEEMRPEDHAPSVHDLPVTALKEMPRLPQNKCKGFSCWSCVACPTPSPPMLAGQFHGSPASSLSPAWGASAEWDCFGQQKKYNPNNMYHRRHLSIS